MMSPRNRVSRLGTPLCRGTPYTEMALSSSTVSLAETESQNRTVSAVMKSYGR